MGGCWLLRRNADAVNDATFQSIDIDRAMQLSFDAFSDLVSMQEVAQAFNSAEQSAIEKAETLEQKDRSQTIPVVGNVRGHCKTFIQKADHFAVSLLSITRLFYPEMKARGWTDFHRVVKSRYGESDNFYKVSELTTPFLALVRNARDCLEHNLAGIKTSDFEPQPDGTIAPPSIEIDFRKRIHERCPLSWFMEETTKALLDSFEMIVVHTCSPCYHSRWSFTSCRRILRRLGTFVLPMACTTKTGSSYRADRAPALDAKHLSSLSLGVFGGEVTAINGPALVRRAGKRSNSEIDRLTGASAAGRTNQVLLGRGKVRDR